MSEGWFVATPILSRVRQKSSYPEASGFQKSTGAFCQAVPLLDSGVAVSYARGLGGVVVVIHAPFKPDPAALRQQVTSPCIQTYRARIQGSHTFGSLISRLESNKEEESI